MMNEGWSVDTPYEAVIGLEVHVQLATESKVFSSARARLGEGFSVADETPNANTTEVCAAHPGTLPVLNEKALEYAVKAGLATGCRIATLSQFARKHYFYPDLPKGYQISQHDQPLCLDGHLDIETESGPTKRIRIQRIHVEEDAGKSTHAPQYTLVNLNRAGIPLIEVVSHPDMNTPEEAGAYLRKLYAIVTAIQVCDGNLQEGNFRCDANVSIRKKGDAKLGTRTEIKNVNSFRFVEKAIEYEIQRQRQVLISGGVIIQETRLYDSQKNQTQSMRKKEEAEDYRYFPDPDLPPIRLDPTWIDSIQKSLPELPDQKRDRFMTSYGLTRYDAGQLTESKSISDFYEAAVKGSELRGKLIANLILGEAKRLIQESESAWDQSLLKPTQIAEIARLIQEDVISVTAAKQMIQVCFQETVLEISTLVDRLGLRQMNDLSALDPIMDELMQKNPKQVEEFRSGKEKVLGFFVGQMMKATGGKANPSLLNEFVRKKLK